MGPAHGECAAVPQLDGNEGLKTLPRDVILRYEDVVFQQLVSNGLCCMSVTIEVWGRL